MKPVSKASVSDPEFFFSDSFLMQVQFHNGLIDGWIIHYPLGLNLEKSFRGISTEENGFIKFSFFIEWSNPNLEGTVLTAYSGEVFNLNDKEARLTLEWLQISEDSMSLCLQAYKGSEVLRGLSEKTRVDPLDRLGYFHWIKKALGRL